MLLTFEKFISKYSILEQEKEEEAEGEEDEKLDDEGFEFDEETEQDDQQSEDPYAEDHYKIGLIDKSKAKTNATNKVNLYKIEKSELEKWTEDNSLKFEDVKDEIEEEDTDVKVAQKLAKAVRNSELGDWYKTVKVNLDQQYGVYSDPELLDVVFIFYNK